MVDFPQTTNWPAQIVEAVSGITDALVPRSLKALDRLIGAGVDIPVAFLEQKAAKIGAQTSAYKAVEAAIASAVASEAEASPEIIQGALDVLVRKSYRKQKNVEAVSVMAIEDLRSNSNS